MDGSPAETLTEECAAMAIRADPVTARADL